METLVEGGCGRVARNYDYGARKGGRKGLIRRGGIGAEEEGTRGRFACRRGREKVGQESRECGASAVRDEDMKKEEEEEEEEKGGEEGRSKAS